MSANLSVTSADVRPLPGAIVQRMQAGGTVTVGYAVYIDSDGYVQHTAGGAIGTTLPAFGVVVAAKDGDTSGASGEWVDVVTRGPVAGFSGMTATGSYAGTYPFMPREQVTNFKYVKPVSDVWAMGATLYHMLTNRYPRDFVRGRDPIEVILRGEIVPIRKRLTSFPRSVAEVIDRSLANKAEDRYQDAGEMLQALRKVL